jgi:hypothetical protein
MASGGGTGDIATWVGAVGTWVVGAVAGIIAYQQYRRDKFRPTETALRDEDRRVVVQIVNEGAGTGVVSAVNLLPPDHPRQALKFYYWEINGKKDEKQRPIPFTLPGRETAQLVLLPRPDMSFDGIRVRVDYGDGSDSGCLEIEAVRGHLYGTTYIPDKSKLTL